jgi:hypothetical protein
MYYYKFYKVLLLHIGKNKNVHYLHNTFTSQAYIATVVYIFLIVKTQRIKCNPLLVAR